MEMVTRRNRNCNQSEYGFSADGRRIDAAVPKFKFSPYPICSRYRLLVAALVIAFFLSSVNFVSNGIETVIFRRSLALACLRFAMATGKGQEERKEKGNESAYRLWTSSSHINLNTEHE